MAEGVKTSMGSQALMKEDFRDHIELARDLAAGDAALVPERCCGIRRRQDLHTAALRHEGKGLEWAANCTLFLIEPGLTRPSF